VRHEHIASLGSLEIPQTIPGRLTLWQRLYERLARLATGSMLKHKPRCSPPSMAASREFGKLIADETEKWAKVIKSAGIKAD
jgi:hypothetical protein